MAAAETRREAERERKTGETQIRLRVGLDGIGGRGRIDTGIPFFDHMLVLLAKHGCLELEIEARGDLEVDYHHTVEDVGLVLGDALRGALGDKAGIKRYGYCYLPMDETLARVVVDLSGRPFLEHRVPSGVESIRGFSFQLVEEFLRALANQLGANVHTEILYGRDAHHMAEAIFKGLGRALRQAMECDPRVEGVPSTKGVL